MLPVSSTFDSDPGSTRRRAMVSALFGVSSAVIMGIVGPLWGGLLVILLFALVFRSEDRVSLASLLSGFGLAWAIVLVMRVGVTGYDAPSSTPVWAVAGLVPIALSSATVVLARWRSRRRQTSGGLRPLQ